MATVRKAEISDLKDVEYICRMTAGEGARRDEHRGKIVAKTYSTYYIEHDCDSCFVLADEKNTAVGYILCAPEASRFKRIYLKEYVPQIRALSRRDGREAFFIPFSYMLFSKKYPAHLHINLMPDFQGAGYGSVLMRELFEHLKNKNVPGVMLEVDSYNTGAVAFYKKHGFKVLFEGFGAVLMGKNLR